MDEISAKSTAASKLLVTLRAWQFAITLVVLGVGLLALSAYLAGSKSPSALETTIREVGALLLVTGALSVFWDLRGRRALADEVMATANLASNLKMAGLDMVSTRYLDSDWDDMIAGARCVDLFFAYGQTWRNTHATSLRKLVEHEGVRLRMLVPDRHDPELMKLLAAKFGYETSRLCELIEGAEADIKNLQRQASQKASVAVKRVREFPVFSYYRFDGECVVTLYSQTPELRVDVPVFRCSQGGFLYGFFQSQFDDLWDSIRSREQTGSA